MEALVDQALARLYELVERGGVGHFAQNLVLGVLVILALLYAAYWIAFGWLMARE